MKNFSSFIFTIAIVLCVANFVRASCPWMVQYPPCAEFGRADAIFIATATKVESQPVKFRGVTSPSVVRFAIEESFKGINADQFVLEQSVCGYQFKEGEKYLVYAHRNQNDGKLFVRLGGTRTKPFAEAFEDIEFLRSLQRGEAQPQIVGKIGHQTAEIKKSFDSSFFDDIYFFGAPLEGIKVFAKNAEQTYETVSDARGEYRFFGLPAGAYEIWADYPSYFESRKELIQTQAEGCGVGNIKALRKGSINGRLVDASGAAAGSLRLSLVLADAPPQEIFEERENRSVWYSIEANEKGEFRFANLPAVT